MADLTHNSLIGYDDQYQRLEMWSTLTATAAGSGTADAAFPVSNVLNARPGSLFIRRGLTVGQTIEIEIAALQKTPRPERGAGAMIAVMNCYGIEQSTGYRFPIRVRCRVFSAAFTVTEYDATIDPAGSYGLGSGRLSYALPFVYAGRTEPSGLQAIYRADGGADNSAGSFAGVRLTLTNANVGLTNPVDVVVERVMMQRGFWCTIEPGLGVGYADESDVLRSYSGRPFVRAKNVVTSMQGRLTRVDYHDVFGGINNQGEFQRSTLHSINRVAGRSQLVTVVRDLTVSPFNGQTRSSAVIQDVDCLVGLLDQPMALRHESALQGAQRALYSADFAVTASF